MNKLCYRLVFNKKRGMLMAVQESARSQGKGRGETAAPGGAEACVAALPVLRRLALLLGTAFGGGLLSCAALAQVVADPSAPGQQRATVLRAANGVLQVNVQTPSAAGVSRNVYSQFDVPASGAILNNARTDVQTQLGGWIQANPWMKDGSARVILNEVRSGNPSRLQGFIEVAGQRAETVIANPAGIVVDGGGFINVSRATLTTGSPILRDGQLDGFKVERGHIAIEGAGLDASQTDYTALIARSTQLNAGLWAKQLEVVTGVNEVALGNAEGQRAALTSATQGSAGAPRYAIDVAQLGGMYANQIWLVGTEHGVGVRNAGEIGAGAGELVVTSSGRLENTGSLAAATRLQAEAQAIDNSGGRIQAPTLELAAAAIRNDKGSIVQTGTQALAITAQQVSNAGGTLGEQATPAAPVAPAAPADAVTTPDAAPSEPVPVSGTTDASAPVEAAPGGAAPAVPGAVLPAGTIKAEVLDNDGGLIAANGAIGVDTARFANLGGKSYLDYLTVTGPVFDNAGGSLSVVRELRAAVDSFGNREGTILAGNRIDIKAGQADNRAGLLQARALALGVDGQLDNGGGTLRHSGTATMTLKVGGALVQDAGRIDVAGALDLGAGRIAGLKGTLNVVGDLELSSGETSAAQGSWQVGGNARIATGKLDSTEGAISAGGALALEAQDWDNSAGTLASGGAAQLRTGGTLDNTKGLIQSGASMRLDAGGAMRNSGGTIETLGARATLDVTAATIDNAAGRLVNSGNGDTRVAAAGIATSGLIGGNGNVAIDAETLVNHGPGRIVAARDMSLSVSGLLANAGGVAAGADLAVSGARARLDNTGTMLADGTLSIDNGAVDNRGTIATASGGQGLLAVRTGQLANTGGTLQAAGDAELEVRNNARNTDGTIRAGGRLVLEAGGTVSNSGGDIVGASSLAIRAHDIANLAGAVLGSESGSSRPWNGSSTRAESGQAAHCCSTHARWTTPKAASSWRRDR